MFEYFVSLLQSLFAPIHEGIDIGPAFLTGLMAVIVYFFAYAITSDWMLEGKNYMESRIHYVKLSLIPIPIVIVCGFLFGGVVQPFMLCDGFAWREFMITMTMMFGGIFCVVMFLCGGFGRVGTGVGG